MSSKYAKKIKQLLREVYPKPQPILEEVSVASLTNNIIFPKSLKDLIDKYDARLSRMRVDFYVKGQVAIEVQGEQHEVAIKFSNEIQDIEAELIRRKGLDQIKQEALNSAGVPFICIWYYEIKDLTFDKLKEKIKIAQTLAESFQPNRIINDKAIIKKPSKKLFFRKKIQFNKLASISKKLKTSKLKWQYSYYKEEKEKQKNE